MSGKMSIHEDLPCDYDGSNDDYDDTYEDTSRELISLDDIIQKNISKNVRDLKAFLSSGSFVTEKGDQRTNIINVSEKKTFCVPETHIEDFFSMLDACRKEQRMLHYSERQETSTVSHSGIMIDFDRYQRAKDTQITDRHFETLTRHICRLLNEFIDFSPHATYDKYTFRVFYIKKPSVVLVPPKTPDDTSSPVYKDGFHVLIPEIQVTKGLKHHLIRELASRGIIKSTFKDIDHIDEPEKMLDRMSASNPVHFVGNSKPGKPAYPLTHAYEITIYVDEDDIDRRVLDVSGIQQGLMPNGADQTPINLTYELSLSFYTPTFHGRPTWLRKTRMEYKPELETKIQLLVEKTAKDIIPEDDILRADNSIDILTMGNAEANHLKKLLEILDLSYATEYEKWFKVICAIAHTSEQYKPLAIWFSHRKPESWSESEIERVWDEAVSGKQVRKPVTKRSIMFWARSSSPQRYKEVEKENYFNVLARGAYDNEGRIEHALAARVVHAMIGDKFIVDVGLDEKTGRTGYIYNEFVIPGQSMKKGEVYKWRKEAEPDNIHLFIAEQLPKVFAPLITNIKDRKDNAQNKGEAKYWSNVLKNFRMSTSRLGNDQFQNGIIKQARYKFRVRGFMDELDSYEDIIGVGNGILKLGSKPQLIKGFHEYKVSKYTEVDYVPYDPESPYVKTLMKAFSDIFIEPDVCEFMLYHASTWLDAKESACILLLMTGGGENGKSFFLKMIHNTIGNTYCAAGKPSLLTMSAERSESANSAQVQQRGRRGFYIDEFNKSEWLNPMRVKAMVTPGWQSGRDLHERQSNFKNTSNTVCASNFDFIIDTTDHGTWRRIYYYKNKVKFCVNPDPANPYEKLADTRFIDEYTNDPMYKQAMLSIMSHYYGMLCTRYRGDLKKVPVPTIIAETEEFRNRQDAINRFITQMIVKSPDSPEIGLPSLASKYIEWYSKNVKTINNQTGLDVQAQFENSRIHGALSRRIGGFVYLIGHRLKAYAEEPLREGESSLLFAVEAPRAKPEDTHVDFVAPEREVDPLTQSLVRGAPLHIQRSDNIAEPELSLEDILGL